MTTSKISPPAKSRRTVHINHNLAIDRRVELGLTQHQLAIRTDIIVLKLAQAEKDERDRGQFYRRELNHGKRMQLAGLSVSTISNAERGRPVYLETVVVLAKTLELPLKDLIVWHH